MSCPLCERHRLVRDPFNRPCAPAPSPLRQCNRNVQHPTTTTHISHAPRLIASASGVEPVVSAASASMATQSIATQQSTSDLASAAAATLVPPPTASVFEPQLPDAGVLAAQGLVLALTVAAAGYWWLVVVPSERAALGRSKRLGPLDNYLRELERPETARERRLEVWFYSDWLRQRQERRERRQQRQQPGGGADGGDAPAASGTAEDPYDTTQPDDPNLLRPSALTPAPRFLSLDNPIVATAALLLLAAAVAGLQQH
ncbi:hypothetical protein PLESTF_000104100 [Pleodorina starrii]|nr:hypothetical protein PLESTM_001269900 [Pleodorina starrii]GLC63969.1 hypothetical protein PLESTF_000104100 [Pleodorina starrii]